MIVSTPEEISLSPSFEGSWTDNCIMRAHGDQTNPAFQGSSVYINDNGTVIATSLSASTIIATSQLRVGGIGSYFYRGGDVSQIVSNANFYIVGQESVAPASQAPVLKLSSYFFSSQPIISMEPGTAADGNYFELNTEGGSNGDALVFDIDGQLGINQTSPSAMLDIVQNGAAVTGLEITGAANRSAPLLQLVEGSGTPTAGMLSFLRESNTGSITLQSTLWVVDDTTQYIYHVTLSGEIIFSTKLAIAGVASLAVDPSDYTLWIASESTDTVYNISRSGAIISSFSKTAFDAAAIEIEGVTVSTVDNTLWVVDDVTHKVYNLERNGTLISSFLTTDIDPSFTGPQEIAWDDNDNTLWLIDNAEAKIYHVTTAGALISSFNCSLYSTPVSPQGICVDGDYLWVSDRTTSNYIFKITKTGTLISSFLSTIFDAASLNPCAVAVDLTDMITIKTSSATRMNITKNEIAIPASTSLQIGDSLTLLGNGNLGINIKNPQEKLDVVGNIRIKANFGLVNSQSNSFNGFSGDTTLSTGGNIVMYGASHSTSPGAIMFRNQTAYRMIISPNGNIGIGTTAPDKKLEINKSTGGEIRLTYNDSNGSATDYCDFVVDANGGLTITTVDSDGAAGDITLSPDGLLNVGANIYPGTDDTYYLGKNSISTPLAWKGLVLKDTTDGNYYRIEIINGVITATQIV